MGAFQSDLLEECFSSQERWEIGKWQLSQYVEHVGIFTQTCHPADHHGHATRGLQKAGPPESFPDSGDKMAKLSLAVRGLFKSDGCGSPSFMTEVSGNHLRFRLGNKISEPSEVGG